MLLDAVESPEEVQMPPGTAEFPIRDRLQADLLLLPDDAFDLPVLDFFQLCRRYLAASPLLTRFFKSSGPQQASHMICTKRRFFSLTHFCPQISSASSTIILSFVHCSSSAKILPSSVEAKPHCGDRHSCSSGTYLAA